MMARWKTLPGETPIDDVSELKIKAVRNRTQLNAAEAENIRKATVKYLARRPSRRVAPFTLSWAKKLHKEMFGEVWSWAGRFRLRDLNIGVGWQQVEQQLHNLLADLTYWGQQELDILEQAAMLHHRAVQIHPFQNGNGRWARLLTNIWLKQHRHAPIEWNEPTMAAQSALRADYLVAIKQADNGDYAPLIALHRRLSPLGQ